MKDDDPLTAELEFLAKNAPSKFKIMTIKDNDINLIISVDQSMDSSFKESAENVKSTISKIGNVYFHFKGKPYDGYLNGISNIDIGGLNIDFQDVSGERAHNWMMRYFKVLLKLMEDKGIISLTELGGV